MNSPAATCRKCGGDMRPGRAIRSTVVAVVPDFAGDDAHGRGQTMSEGGPGIMVDVLKCSRCGHSYTTAASTQAK